MPAVTAIARVPQARTRIVAVHRDAPPSRAPRVAEQRERDQRHDHGGADPDATWRDPDGQAAAAPRLPRRTARGSTPPERAGQRLLVQAQLVARVGLECAAVAGGCRCSVTAPCARAWPSSWARRVRTGRAQLADAAASGIHASIFDATAALIAVAVLGVPPVGPSVAPPLRS
jgi:hypothetical protein